MVGARRLELPTPCTPCTFANLNNQQVRRYLSKQNSLGLTRLYAVSQAVFRQKNPAGQRPGGIGVVQDSGI